MQSLFGMDRVQLNVTQEIVDAGFNITALNAASSVLNSWARTASPSTRHR